MSNNSLEIKSLVFFFFGFTDEDDIEIILTKIVEKAYFDATQQGAFNTLLRSDDNRIFAFEAKKNVTNMIIKYLRQNYSEIPNVQKEFNKWHEKKCDEIKNEYWKLNKSEEKFTYGNAQKLLNMTMKYSYMLAQIGINNKDMDGILKKARELEGVLHVPIDSYIIDAIWMDTKIDLPIKDGYKEEIRSKDYKTPSDYVKGWSTWNKNDYTSVQSSLCDYIKEKKENPIVWEEQRWIEIAKIRN